VPEKSIKNKLERFRESPWNIDLKRYLTDSNAFQRQKIPGRMERRKGSQRQNAREQLVNQPDEKSNSLVLFFKMGPFPTKWETPFPGGKKRGSEQWVSRAVGLERFTKLAGVVEKRGKYENPEEGKDEKFPSGKFLSNGGKDAHRNIKQNRLQKVTS